MARGRRRAARAAASAASTRWTWSPRGRDLDPPDGFSFPYALQTLLDELTLAPVVAARRRAGRGRAADRRRRGRLRRADRRPATRSTRCTPSCSRSATASAAASAPSASRCRRRCWSACATLRGAPETRRSQRAAREACRRRRGRCPCTSSTCRRRRARSGARGHRAAGGVGPRRRHRLDRGARGGGGAAAGARADRRRGALPPERCVDPDEMFAELETQRLPLRAVEHGGRA